MANFEAFSEARGWYKLNITDEHGTINCRVTPETVGSKKIRAIGNDGTVAECVWLGTAWLGVPENDFNAAYIANRINAANIIFGGER